MTVPTQRLKQLVTVADAGSFSKAAIQLRISQPALSRSIAALEARHGFPIFNRVGHGVELTAAGTQVIAQARLLLQHLNIFENNLKLIGSGCAGELHVGFAPLLASQLMPDLANQFFGRGTQAQLHIVTRPGDDLLHALKSDLVEFIVYPETFLEADDSMDVQHAGSIEAACVVRAEHPLAGKEGLSLDDLAPYPWAYSVKPPIPPPSTNGARFVCENYHILREAVLATDLISICSLSFVKKELADGLLRVLHIDELPIGSVDIYIATLKGRISSPLALDFMQAIQRRIFELVPPVCE